VWPGPIPLSRIYVTEGRPQDALPEIARVRYGALRTRLYSVAYAALGHKKESDAALQELIVRSSTTEAFLVAEVMRFGTSEMKPSSG